MCIFLELKNLHLALSDWEKHKLLDYPQFVDGMLRPVTTPLSNWTVPIIATVLVQDKPKILWVPNSNNNQPSIRQFDVSTSIIFSIWDNSVNKSHQKKMLKFSSNQQRKWSRVISSNERFSKFNDRWSDFSFPRNVWKPW
jgi:hypothetical protein